MPVPVHALRLGPSAANLMQQASVHPGAHHAINAAQSVTSAQNVAQSALASRMVPGSPEARRRDKAQAHAEVLNEKPGIINRVIDKFSGLGSAFFMYDFAALMGLGAITGGIFKGLNKVSERSGIKAIGSVGNWFGRRHEGLKAQSEFIHNTSISEGLSKTSTALKEKTVRVFGEESMAARGMAQVAEGAEQAQAGLNRGAGWAVGKASTALGGVATKFGPERDALSALHTSRAARHMERIGEHLKAAQTALAQHGEGLATDVMHQEMNLPLRTQSTFVAEGAKEGVSRTAAEHMANLRGNFTEMEKLLASTPSPENARRATQLLSEVRGDLSAVRTLHAHVDNTAMKQGASELGQALKKMERPLAGLAGNLEKAKGWRSMPETLAKLPQTLGKTSMHKGMMAGAIGATTLASGAHTAFGVKHDFHVLKTMVEAVEGKKVSTMHVLAGDIPPMLKEARHHFFGRHKPEVIAEAIAGVANLAFLKSNASMATHALTMAGLMGAPMLGQALADQNPTIMMYEAMVKLQNAGQALTPDMYAEFVHSLVEDPKTMDLGKHRPQARDQLFAEYAATNTSVDQVLRDVHSGAMEQRVSELEQQLAASAATQEKQPVGQHTAKVLQNRAQTAVQSTAPVANENAAHATAEAPATTISHAALAGRVAMPMQGIAGATA